MAINKLLFGNNSYQLMRAALDASALRQKVIADNVANAETPGFRPHEVAFEELLNQARGGAEALPLELPEVDSAESDGGMALVPGGLSPLGAAGSRFPRPQIIESPPPDATSGAEAGDFDMERAMADLNSNRIQYSALTQLLSNRLIGLKSAIESR